MRKRIVIADDDSTMRTTLHEALCTAGYQTVPCSSGEEASRVIKEGGVDLVISDVRMPGMDGLELLRHCQTTFASPPFIMISGHATVSEAVEAMKMKAYDFLVKPFSYRELVDLVEAALRQEGEETETEIETGEIVTSHPRMHALLKFAAEVARSQASVLIQGESGTGKELLARFIHARSRRRSGPFVAVNCAALPEGLLESELFGHERGAFTGAVVSKPGKFELAHSGTLLLDEVSEMPLPLQAKLLRVLQEREVDRVGGRKPLRIDIRVIATTNRNLREMISAGSLREDLFYRLNVIPLRLPPLRERLEDIEALARAFFSRSGYGKASHSASHSASYSATLSPQAVDQLKAHAWRGNIRELFNTLERATILAAGETIGPEHLGLEEEADWGLRAGGQELALGDTGTVAASPTRPVAAPRLSPAPDSQEKETIRAGVSMQEMEERLIHKTLTQVQNNRTQAARLLGISVRTLRNKLKQYQQEEVAQSGSPSD